ncbi:hypothetical protein CCP4SC76_2260007 [Gammaproteobacteria bacterium]
MRSGKPLSLILLDLDHFKAVNDTLGHPTGDAVLQEIGKRVGAHVRTMDLAGRYGGEELVLLLPETEQQEAIIVAERLRVAIAECPVHYGDSGKSVSVTASLGVGTFDPKAEQTTEVEVIAMDLIHRADRELYDAKHNGRNQVRPNPAAKELSLLARL